MKNQNTEAEKHRLEVTYNLIDTLEEQRDAVAELAGNPELAELVKETVTSIEAAIEKEKKEIMDIKMRHVKN